MASGEKSRRRSGVSRSNSRRKEQQEEKEQQREPLAEAKTCWREEQEQE